MPAASPTASARWDGAVSCDNPPMAEWSGAQAKTVIAVGRHARAGLAIARHPAGIGHENPRLSGNIRAEIPGVLRLRLQRGVCRFVDMIDPVGHRLLRRFDPSETTLAHMIDAGRDPFPVLFDGYRHIAEHRRAARTGDCEQVREAGD